MSGALDDLGGIFKKHDLKTARDRHETTYHSLEEVCDEFRAQISGPDPELGPEEQEQVSQAFEQVVREDLEQALSADFEPTEFPDRVDDIVEQLEDILRSPQAEAVVEDLHSWLLSTGLEPLSDETLDDLRQIIKEDIEAARGAISDARSAHDQLRGYLGEGQTDIDQMILEKVQTASSVADFESLAEGLERLERNWIGDWMLDYETEAGEDLYSEILELLEENLMEEVKGQNKIAPLATMLENKSSRWQRSLDSVEDHWTTIETRVDRIDHPNGSFTAADALRIARHDLNPVPSLSSYVTGLKQTAQALNSLNKISHTTLEEYETAGSAAPDGISDEIADIEEHVQTAREHREQIFDAESADEIDDLVTEFDTAVDQLDDELEDLRANVESEIETTRKLATKFDLEDLQSDLNSLLSSATTAERTAELIELYESHMELDEDVMEPVRDELDEAEEEVFTLLLEHDDSDEATADVWGTVIESADQEREESFSALVSLQDKDLIDIEVTVA